MSLNTLRLRLLIIGILASSLWACGQSGPLYLPQDAETQSNQQGEQSSESNDLTPQARLILRDQLSKAQLSKAAAQQIASQQVASQHVNAEQ